MRVVIVGAGVVGSVLSLLLRMDGIDTVIVDPDVRRPGVPLIHSKLLRFKEDIELASISEDVYRKISDFLGVELLRPMESITIIREDCKNEVDGLIPLWSSVGSKADYVDCKDLGVRVYDGELCVLGNGDNLVNIPRVINYVRRSEGYIRGYAYVKDTHSVLTRAGLVKGDFIIITGGAWNKTILSELGIKVPLQPYKCQALGLLTKRLTRIIYDYSLDFYLRPVGLWFDGLTSLVGLSLVAAGDGNSIVEDLNNASVDDWFKEEIIRKVRARLGWAVSITSNYGFCELTPDTKPLLGAFESGGLVLLGGFDGYGAEVGPALALAVKDFIIRGSWPSYVRPYLIDRFLNGWPESWDVDVEAHELCR